MTKRICVIGGGKWGRNHVRTLAELGALGGLVEPDEKRRSALAAEFGGLQTFEVLDDAIAEAFDGFTVATPAASHFDIACQLIDAGKPLLVEKPITLRAADAKELVRRAEKKNVPLMVGHLLLFHPAIRTIKRLIDEDKIGRIQYLYSNRLNLGTIRTGENILWSFAPHDISVFQHLVGARPLQVDSSGGAFLQPGIHDTTLTVLHYPDNIVGHIFVSWLHPFKEHRLVVIGSKGMLSFEDSGADKAILYYEKGVDWVRGEPIPRDGPTEQIGYEAALPLTEELRYFVGRIPDQSIDIANGPQAVAVMDILERATESLLGQNRGGNDMVEPESRPYFVHPSSVVDDDVAIGAGTKIWHFSHVQSGARIGTDCSLGQNVNVGNNVQIGNHVKIQNNVSVYEGVRLEDFVFCGPSAVFTNILDPRSKYPQRGGSHYYQTHVKTGCSIGANATIVCGVTLGSHSFIAAGAVITKDVPDYALMAGVPAKRIGWMCECGERLGDENPMRCTRCDRRYQSAGEYVTPMDGVA